MISKLSSLLRKMGFTNEQLQKGLQEAHRLSALDPEVAKILATSGVPALDKIPVKKKNIKGSQLKPTQNTMVADWVIVIALKMLESGDIGGDLGAIISKDGYIMDGHHRWAATVLASGNSGNVEGWVADLQGRELLKVLNVLTKGRFNIRNGQPGTGNIKDLNPKNVKERLVMGAVSGFSGAGVKAPVDAKFVTDVLTKAFGDVSIGIEAMSANAKYLYTKTPSWSPDRSDMPVIHTDKLPEAIKALVSGEVKHRSLKKMASNVFDKYKF